MKTLLFWAALNSLTLFNIQNVFSQFGNLPPLPIRADINCIKAGPFGNHVFTFNQKKLKFDLAGGYQVENQNNVSTRVAANGIYDNDGNLLFAITLKKIANNNDPIAINDACNLIAINANGQEFILNNSSQPLAFIEGWNSLPIFQVSGFCNQYLTIGMNGVYSPSGFIRFLYLYRFQYNQDGTITKIPISDINGVEQPYDLEVLHSLDDRIIVQVSGAKFFNRNVGGVNRTFIYRDLYICGVFEEDPQAANFNRFIKKVSIVEPGYDPINNTLVHENYMFVQTKNLNFVNSSNNATDHFMWRGNGGIVTDIKLFNESPDRLLISMTDNLISSSIGSSIPICVKSGDNGQNFYELSRSPLYLLTESFVNNTQFDPLNPVSEYRLLPMFTNKSNLKNIYSIAVQDNNELDGKIDYLFMSHEGTASNSKGVSARHNLLFSNFCNNDFTLGNDIPQDRQIYKINNTIEASRSTLEHTHNYNYVIFAKDIQTGDNVSLIDMVAYRIAPEDPISAITILNLRCDYHDFSNKKQYATNHQLFKQNYKTGIGSMQPGCTDVVEYSNITSQSNPRLPETTYANVILTTQMVDVLPNDDVRFYAGDMVHIRHEFRALAGSEFLATITPCQYGICKPCVKVSANPVAAVPYSGGRYATLLKAEPQLQSFRLFHIVPNPVQTTFSIVFTQNGEYINEETRSVSIISIAGKIQMVYKSQHSYDISHLPSGTYMIKLDTKHNSYHARFIKW